MRDSSGKAPPFRSSAMQRRPAAGDEALLPPCGRAREIEVEAVTVRVERAVLGRLTEAELVARVDRQLPAELAGDGRTATAIAASVRRRVQQIASARRGAR